ncbi:hypothetical protein DVDV_3822 [Desulfovibrio sp. DV]|uniref:hypothetical protein n=1 Tax=Desulfovibrio sp. DV TaxID=1844708 RepID=UPI00094B8DDB|nr:hypothetical protein [Desulfovibrio sp. DV]OLN24890.1 hypothetical protein DVDV_3822 [Desulfovibrio sp. DV]
MDADAETVRVAKIEHDLRMAGLDADRYAASAFELLECRLPSTLVLKDDYLLGVLLHRLVCLIGSLEQGWRLARELKAMGGVL